MKEKELSNRDKLQESLSRFFIRNSQIKGFQKAVK